MAKQALSKDSVLWGSIFIVVGSLLLVDQLFDVQIWGTLWKFWPALLIVWGISILLEKKK